MDMKDVWGAFCDQNVTADPKKSGTLDGLTFAAKDVFAVEGYVSGAGNPVWKATHEAATRNAKAIDLLLNQGARLVGMTHTDELMFSLNGENHHYGTPINPKAVDHIPGGSSSGSAVAVSAGLVDFALGTDTGGSVRIPGSYCGIYGFRPSHGAVPMDGVIPLAPMFDTVGWFARDAATMLKVGKHLILDQPDQPPQFQRLCLAEDMLNVLNEDSKQAVVPVIRKIQAFMNTTENVEVSKEGLPEWMRVFRFLQGSEIWKTHKDWIEKEKPQFGPGIAERFQWSSTLESEHLTHELKIKHDIRQRMKELLGDHTLLITPTAPGAAPLRNMKGEELNEIRSKTLLLCCVAGLSGLPQITLPLANKNGLPMGISIIAGPDQDIRLLAWVEQMVNALKLNR